MKTYGQKEYDSNHSSVAQNVLSSIHKRFSNYEEIELLLLSKILYPRFKYKIFSEQNENNIALNSLQHEFEAVYNSNPNRFSTTNEQEISNNSDMSLVRKSLFSDILADHRKPQRCKTAESEIKTYLKGDLLNEECYIYNYWLKSQLLGLNDLASTYH